VHFSRLRLTGFKSFVEPTELQIEPGLTGVVGPNGCGKSNLVEALRWVMGESSAKQMRGGEMDDVIFGGTSERPARNLAEVILTLDNADLSAPPTFNNESELDISRRIERGSGSTYRINSRETRARDVQTLFADVSSGARSTALVSQGRIGAIINAKPADRRHLLEEAAGIGGLHSRRHEAELRLRAAETNLERLDDLMGSLEEQLRGLKRQARQATRYRNLSDHVRRAEGILLHQRWTEANARIEAARIDLKQAEEAVAETTRAAAAASATQADASAIMPQLRQTSAETGAALQRILVARDALDAEEKRLEAARDMLQARLVQIGGDMEREAALSTDATNAQDQLTAESQELLAAQGDEAAELTLSSERLSQATIEVNLFEETLGELTRNVVAEETRQGELNRRIVDMDKRRDRLVYQRAEADGERTQISESDSQAGSLATAKSTASDTRERLEKIRAGVLEAEQLRASSQMAENDARQTYQTAEAEAAKRRASAGALSDLLQTEDADLWPSMVDAISVEPGYEVALGAALGDDLVAPADEAAPVFWRSLDPYPNPPALPQGARALTEIVKGPPVLQRRLSQIGLVENEDDGVMMAKDLLQGQRLVSKSGALWRWDGFTTDSGAVTSAANRLAQRNKLDDLQAELPALEDQAQAAKSDLEGASAALLGATTHEKEARELLWTTDREFQEARDMESTLTQAAADARSRFDAITTLMERLSQDIAEVDGQLETAREELGETGDLAARRAEITERRNELAARRGALAERQRDHDRLSSDSAARRHRLKTIEAEIASWQSRTQNAEQQQRQLIERRDQATDELADLQARPAEIAVQRTALIEQIEIAEAARDKAGDALAEAETALEELARDLRATEALLADQREERVRREGAVEQIEQEIQAIVERIHERIECGPGQILEAIGIKPGEELPDREKIEIRLERLIRERDNMGPVNLRAETEAVELAEKIDTLVTEREDLTSAIARLRQGISSLNREGRERLMSAFTDVDRHFRDLYTRLFGGGSAHLTLTEADDPFEAGLEIMASPPGKKLQTMSLMSGGEQALAALALLFAVFLTNPAPICVLDEVDAPLDDHNVDRFCTMLAEIARDSSTRFLLITHHRLTMARMDRLYGVTMGEQGVSQLVSVDLQTAEDLRESA
jgi:chromosome segregation protein